MVAEKAKENKEPKVDGTAKKPKADGAAKEPKVDGAAKADKVASSDVEKLRAELAKARDQLSLHSQPVTTMSLFLRCTAEFAVKHLSQILCSSVLWLAVAPLVGLWLALKQTTPELFAPPLCGQKEAGLLWQVEFAVQEAAWWIILGVLSSIGFGTGLHSGMMFLFPHVLQVVAAAEACHTTQGLVAWYQHPCKLDCSTTFGPKDDSTVTIGRLFMSVTVPCMLWGFGTAVGELPPYAVSKTARLSGHSDTEFDEELKNAKDSKDVFSRMKMWTIEFTERHGFFGVFMLASWPNAAFDMCGMCCGYLMMPFWTFFIATALGKGVVKVNGQAFFFVNLFGSGFFKVLLSCIDSVNSSLTGLIGKDLGLSPLVVKFRTKLLSTFELQSRLPPEKLFAGRSELDLKAIRALYHKYDGGEAIADRVLAEWDHSKDGKLSLTEVQTAASRTDAMVSLGSLDPGAGTSILKMCWELFIVCLVFYFVFSIVNQLARMKQSELDEEVLAKHSKGKQEAKKTK
uniref:EF-hand domain-containing protein n=1 Tax=Alexandrium catenella TaxID=2925 RepID=A0A7S1Q988_ALECA